MVLVWLAAAFIAGIFAGSEVVAAVLVLLAGTTTTVVLAAALWRNPSLRLASLLVLTFLLGMARAESNRLHIAPNDLAYYNGSNVTLVGYVSAEPDVRDTGINYVVTVSGMERGTKLRPIHGQMELHTTASQLLNEGDQIQVAGSLLTPRNSAVIPYRDILAHRGIYSEMSFARLFVTGHVSLGLFGVAETLRQDIENSISGALPEPEATLLIAILVGARSAQLGTLAPILVRTGLVHLIAVSGVKIAIVAGTVNSFFRRLMNRTVTLVASSGTIGAYWLVSGATVAGLRASIMWLLVFIAAYLGRPTYALVSLGVATSAMLTFDPNLLWDTGFELTVLATAAIISLSPFLTRATRRLPSAVAAAITTSFAAQIGVLPVQITGFHLVSFVSVLANGLVLPFIPLTMAVGFLLVIVPWPPLAAIAYSLVHILVLIAHTTATLPLSSMALTQIPLGLVLAYYGLLIAASVVGWKLGQADQRRVRGEWFIGLAVALMGLGLTFHHPASHNRIVFLTNGSALLRAGDQTVLIDGGSRPSRLMTSLGAALPFPDQRIDAVIDTDPRSKNIASLLGAVRHYHVGKVLDPGMEYPSQTYARWSKTLMSSGLGPLALRPGVTLRGRGFNIVALAPDGLYSDPRDGAGALMITDHGERILYLGPASAVEQQNMAFRINVRADVVISSVPLDPTFRQAVQPSRVVRPVKSDSISLHS